MYGPDRGEATRVIDPHATRAPASVRSAIDLCPLIEFVTLTDVPDSCYRRRRFFVHDPEESVYGDQGQEVAWEVWQERFVAKREQEEQEQEIARQVGRRERFSIAKCVLIALEHGVEAWAAQHYET